ncbi:DnaJ domain [Dillenia turbinata]|uniref:DnaJ domain n=1 Tax=Dillenia turbinata TaxID=194707 RepID=A0AAN8YTF4_9MAGN
MNTLSLVSTPNTTKLPYHKSLLRKEKMDHKFTSVSCRASTLTSQNETSNFYKLLSLSPDREIDRDDIKRAYRKLALRYHPDLCHDPSLKEESTKMFVQLQAAFQTLSNPATREEYDYKLGLRNRSKTSDVWMNQVFELRRKGQRVGSWGSKIRAQNRQKLGHHHN